MTSFKDKDKFSHASRSDHRECESQIPERPHNGAVKEEVQLFRIGSTERTFVRITYYS